MSGFVFCNDEAASCVFVESVYDSGAEVFSNVCDIAEVVDESVYESAGLVAACGVDDHFDGLVHDDNVLIFVNYVQWDIFGYDFADLFLRKGQLDAISGVEVVACFCWFSVNVYALLFYELLDSASGKLIEAALEVFVEPSVFEVVSDVEFQQLAGLEFNPGLLVFAAAHIFITVFGAFWFLGHR